jgi:hypothetical protein
MHPRARGPEDTVTGPVSGETAWERLASALTRAAAALEGFLGALERRDAPLARRMLDASRQARARSQRLERAATAVAEAPENPEVTQRIRSQLQRISLVDGILKAVLPSLESGPEDPDAFIDANIAPTWDLALDVVLLVGASAARHALAFAARGYRRVLVVLGKGAPAPAGVNALRDSAALETALLSLHADPPERYVVLAPGAPAALKAEVEANAAFLLQALRHEVVYVERWGLERVTNALRNAPVLARSGSVGDVGVPFKGRAALVVCPGPSLDGCLDLISANRDRFVVFAVNHAVGNLVRRGVSPDFVLALDPAPWLVDHLAGHDLGGVSGLIVGASVTPPLVALPSARRVLSANFAGPADAWLDPIVGAIATVETGGTVAHAAAVIATRWGCDPVVFVGQDLAFKGQRQYANDTVHPMDTNLVEGEPPPPGFVLATGWRGERLLASTQFASYRTWYERWIRTRPKTRFINCSEGGARIDGMRHMALRDLVGTLPRAASADVEARLLAATRERRRPDSEAIRALLQDRVARLDVALAHINAPDVPRAIASLEGHLKTVEETLSSLPEAAFATEAAARRYRSARADSASSAETREALEAHLADLGRIIATLRAAAHDALSDMGGIGEPA